MRSTFAIAALLSAALLAAPVAAQTAAPPPAAQDEGRPIVLQHYRPTDRRGLNMFESPKEPGPEYTGFKFDIGAAFTAQAQGLRHENGAAPRLVNGIDANRLIAIGNGFNNSTANLYLNAQLAEGVRVQLTAYLSSRHHNETWVKDGYVLVDKLPIDAPLLNLFMQYVTVKAGHMEINYGDAHFRRTDNGMAMYNPFVGNYLMDAFTTEIGAEVYLRSNGIIAMGSLTGGEIRGTVLTPEQRSPSLIGKLGFDRQINPKLRIRLTGSMYKNNKSASNTLYGGDRAGSRFYYVLENTTATEAAQKSSGMFDPGFKNKVTALQLNPFVKVGGLELFGVLERADGRTAAETDNRRWRQHALDAVYRFAPREQAFVGARYNKAEGELAGIANNVGARRWELGGGWFMTRNILMKAEYVHQEYFDFPETDIRHGGKFTGGMLEGVIAF
jgi:hypothetical protein